MGGRGTMRRSLRKLSIAAAVAACAAALMTTAAHGAYTIGNLAPAGSPADCFGAQADIVQTNSTVGNSYAVPVDGTITSWSTQQGPSTAGAPWKLKVFRLNSGLNYTAVGSDGPRTLVPNSLNTFTTGVSIPVKAGDVLGLNRSTGTTTCVIPGFGGTIAQAFPSDLPNGSSTTFTAPQVVRLNISAQVQPLNTFSLGAVKRNKKKGTAQVIVTVPGAGALALAGNGVKAVAATAAAKGDVPLVVRSRGKKKAKLNDKGKVKLSPEITFTPTNGLAATQSTKLKLKKK
jgi:hypothetical protein